MATTKAKGFNENWIFALVPVFVLVAIFHFLINRDGGISGAQALGLQGAAFWVVAIIGVAIAGFLAFKVINGARNETMKPVTGIVLVIVAVTILFSVFGKACETKADPVTAPKVLTQ